MARTTAVVSRLVSLRWIQRTRSLLGKLVVKEDLCSRSDECKPNSPWPSWVLTFVPSPVRSEADSVRDRWNNYETEHKAAVCGYEKCRYIIGNNVKYILIVFYMSRYWVCYINILSQNSAWTYLIKHGGWKLWAAEMHMAVSQRNRARTAWNWASRAVLNRCFLVLPVHLPVTLQKICQSLISETLDSSD